MREAWYTFAGKRFPDATVLQNEWLVGRSLESIVTTISRRLSMA
jgi:hypothetical protein